MQSGEPLRNSAVSPCSGIGSAREHNEGGDDADMKLRSMPSLSSEPKVVEIW